MKADNGKPVDSSAGTATFAHDPGAAPAIEVRGLFKSFRIPTDRPETLKERAVHPFRAPPVRRLDVIRNVSFDVLQGEFFGIVGRNGSGKSTLLKLMASIYRADRGRTRVAGTISPIIELGIGFQAELSARDNVITNALMLGLTPREARRRFDAVIEFAELEDFVDLKLRNYSSGMRARLAFAIAIQADPDILLLDEVLAVGDPPFQERCRETFAELKQRGRSTIVLVTHNQGLIKRYCDRAMMLEGGRIDYIGDPNEVTRRYSRLRGSAEVHGDDSAGVHVDDSAGVHVDEHVPSRIVAISLLNAGGKGPTAVEPGEPLLVQMALEADEPLEKPRLRFWIEGKRGVKIFAPSPFPLRADDRERLGAGEGVWVGAKIENKLAPGRYRLCAMLVSGSGERRVSSEVGDVALKVRSNGKRGDGLVSLNYEIRTQPGSPARSS